MITLITDFGLASEYAGVMKGVVFSHSPQSSIVDISNSVPPQDILHAAYMIRSAFFYFPKGTIHVIVVDPGVGSGRDIVLLEATDHLFLFPDNGVATLLIDDFGPACAYRVSREDLFLQPVSATFHGRDIFAPVASYLDKGMKPSEVGPEIATTDLVRLNIPYPVIDADRCVILGEVISIDSYGSLVSNISRENISDWGYDFSSDGCFSVGVCEKTILSLNSTYCDVEKGALLALIGSRGFLEIAMNGGSAAHLLHAAVGTEVVLTMR